MGLASPLPEGPRGLPLRRAAASPRPRRSSARRCRSLPAAGARTASARLLRPLPPAAAHAAPALPPGPAGGDRRRAVPGPPAGAPRRVRDQAEYEAALDRVLRSVRATDRRLGLLNLFWLAHTRDVAECLQRDRGQEPRRPQAQVLAAPAALVVLPRLDQAARRDVEQGDPGQAAFLAGAARTRASSTRCSRTASPSPRSPSPTSTSTSSWPPTSATGCPRTCSSRSTRSCVRETERRLREGDRGLLSRVARHMPEPAQGAATRPRRAW